MLATAEQEAICESHAQILRVKAFAGTGKTTTLQMLAARRPHERLLYVAFNKGIQVQAQQKFRAGNVTARTAHGLAFAHVGHVYGDVPRKLLQGSLKPFHVLPKLTKSVNAIPKAAHNLYGARVIEALTNYLVSADPELTVDHVSLGQTPIEKRFFDPRRVLMDAEAIWAQMQDVRSPLPIVHDGYLKLFQISQPRLPYDTVLFDEAQDTNPVTQALVEAQAGRKVYVGDEHQAIYAFRGARNAMALIQADESHCLTGSFRFGPAIAELANALLQAKGEEVRVEGLGPPSAVGLVNGKLPYTFLARSNSAIFNRAIQALDRNEAFALVGALYSYRFDLIEQTYRLSSGKPVTDPFLKSFASYEALMTYAEAMDDKEVASRCRLVNKYGPRIPALVRRIGEQARAYPDPSVKVVLATAHRAKGLEFPQVQLADDFMEFQNQKTGEWKNLRRADVRVQEEVNLQYVAVTRAQQMLQIGDRLNDFWRMTQERERRRLQALQDAIETATPAVTAANPAVAPSLRRRFADRLAT